MVKDLLPIGRVVKPHGVKGKIKVEYFGEDLNHFPPVREVFIEDSLGRPQAYGLLETSAQPPLLLLRIEGIERREEVQALVGKEIFIRRADLPDLKEGEYYWFEITGMQVETERGRRLGRVKEIFPTGANDVYVVEGRRREILLPATEEVIKDIDLKKGVMKVNRMEGLWEEEDEI
ncbi:MAG: 16S rRNA processing protein RimM [Syntrophaceae bacterium]|nr:16S rRNA processing protein RimM [Syntrophaceae bacterium]